METDNNRLLRNAEIDQLVGNTNLSTIILNPNFIALNVDMNQTAKNAAIALAGFTRDEARSRDKPSTLDRSPSDKPPKQRSQSVKPF